eukprot:g12609.t1
MNNSPGSMGSPYGAMDGDMMGDEQNDALQVRPVEHLESMSKLPAHKRRFSATSFPHAYQKPKNLPYYPEGAGVGGEEGYYNEMADEYEDPKFSELLKDLNKMSETVESAAHKIKTGFKEDESSGLIYDYVPASPQFDVNYLRQTLGSNYDGGVMWKKGEGKRLKGILSNTKWRQRFFKVDLSAEVPKVLYFDAQSKLNDHARASGAMRITSATTVFRPQKGKKKTNIKMQNKIDLIVNTSSDKAPDTIRQFNLLCNTTEEAIAWELAIQHIVDAINAYNQQALHGADGMGYTDDDGDGMDENEAFDDEAMQEEKDKAQNIHARGNGLFDAVVGEESSFIIEALDPLTQERLGESDATMLQPNLYITLMTIDPEELEDDDEDDDELNELQNIEKRHEREVDMSKLGKNHLHYDLHAEYDPDAGHFVVRYTVSRVGNYRLKVLLDQHHIYGSPFHVVALPGSTYAKMCQASGNGILYSNPRQVNTFTIVACDKMGNRKDTGGDKFFVQYEGAAIANGTRNEEGFVLPIDNGDGTYTCKYNVDVETARKMVRPSVTINVRIDDGSHFSAESLERFRMMNNSYGDGMDGYEELEYDEDGMPIEKPQKPVERPSWFVQIKGSPFHVPIANSYNEAFPLGVSGGITQNSPMLSNTSKSHAVPTSYDQQSPLRKAQFEAMWDGQQNAMYKSGASLLHAPGSRFEGSPKASYEVGGNEGNLARLAQDSLQFRSTDFAQREAALAEREMKLQQREERMRQHTRDVEEQKARMNSQMQRMNEIGTAVNQAVGFQSSVNSPLGTPIAKSSGQTVPVDSLAGGTEESKALFARFTQPLNLVFKYYAGSSAGVLTLEQYMRLGQDYDLYPTFLNKSELKKCFVEAARGHQTLVFTGFIDALRITAVLALSKKTFKALYPTEASKVHVLLSLWGVGDPLKLEQLRSRHQQRSY